MTELPGTPPATRQQAPRSATKWVLVVDDEPAALVIISRMLKSAGYAVLEASSAREALRLLELRHPRFDLVITDVVMPETDGRTLGRLIAERYPGLPVAYMSAYPMDDVFHRGAQGPDLPFLAKPFTPESLVKVVQEALARSA